MSDVTKCNISSRLLVGAVSYVWYEIRFETERVKVFSIVEMPLQRFWELHIYCQETQLESHCLYTMKPVSLRVISHSQSNFHTGGKTIGYVRLGYTEYR